MTSGPPRPELGALLARLGEDGFVVPARSPRVEWFGDDPALARELGDLPQVGDVEIIVDWSGEPLAVVEVTDVRILPFRDVDEAFACDEGEGDGTRACGRLGREPSETMPVVCRRFRLLHTVGAA